MRMAKLSVLIGGLLLGAALGLAMAGTCAADELPRKADWQMRLASDTAAGGIRIVSIVADSPGARAGLRVGDRIVSIDSQPVASSADIARHRHRSIGGAAIEFVVERDGRRISARMVASARARESYQDLDVRYLAAKTDAGFAVSMIVTRPRDAGRSPAIVFVPWLSCDGIDYPRGAVDGWSRLLLELAHTSGMALVRVEKAGLGDSTGPACVDADLDADMAGYRAALREVARLPEIDPSRIVLFGGSIGAALAPVLARDFPVRAIVASGGFYKTWLEHMLELERRRLGFEGATPAQIGKALRGYAD
ncbi:MAG TPA: PDZ domain-containing protein, partial [Casimicrobiaceae bacterium]|nr:PDZ domain-containing protein [Casimicrobiaceae bacterium]